MQFKKFLRTGEFQALFKTNIETITRFYTNKKPKIEVKFKRYNGSSLEQFQSNGLTLTYYEGQVGAECGAHAMNNLLQNVFPNFPYTFVKGDNFADILRNDLFNVRAFCHKRWGVKNELARIKGVNLTPLIYI